MTDKKCRYSDCKEQHPLAADDEQVTCPTCRKDLGLPDLSESDLSESDRREENDS